MEQNTRISTYSIVFVYKWRKICLLSMMLHFEDTRKVNKFMECPYIERRGLGGFCDCKYKVSI